MENNRFTFLSPPLKCLATTYDVHLRLIGNHVVDLLLMLIELFSLGVSDNADVLRANIDGKSVYLLKQDQFGPKFQVEGVVPTNHSSCWKTRIKHFFIWYKNLARTFFRFVTIHILDRRTDGWTDGFLIAVQCVALHAFAR